MSERANLVGDLDDALVFLDGLTQFFRVERGQLAAIGGFHAVGAGNRRLHVALDARIVDPGVQIAQIPNDVLGSGRGLCFGCHRVSPHH